jgi:hypothetical protein
MGWSSADIPMLPIDCRSARGMKGIDYEEPSFKE